MDQLGIQPSIIIAQIVNFSILAFLLHKFLYKPVLGMLDKRREQIKANLAQAEELKSQAQKWDEKELQLLKSAKQEAAEIIFEAKKQAKLEREKELAAAKVDILRERAKAEKDLAAKFESLQKQAKSQAVNLASEMVRVAVSDLDEDTQKLLIKHSLSSFKKIHASD